jgi:photosystem II stability/assembly factor-like uncharacterized protein
MANVERSISLVRRLAASAVIVVLGLTLFAPPGGATSSVVHRSSAMSPDQTGTGFLSGTACLSLTNCFVVGADGSDIGTVDATTNEGSTWASQTVPSGTSSLFSISCVAPSTCYAAGTNTAGSGTVIVTQDAGSTWVAQSIPSGPAELESITCPSADECFAVGNSITSTTSEAYILATIDGGTTWQIEDTILKTNSDYLVDLYGVTCTSTSSCVASGTVQYFDCCVSHGLRLSPESPVRFQPPPTYTPILYETSNGGTTWTRVSHVPSTSNGAYEVACASTKRCFATTGTTQILASHNGGETWNLETLPPASGDVVAISCPSKTICFAAGTEVAKTLNKGASWTVETVPKKPTGDGKLSSIACASTEVCFATKSYFPNGTNGKLVATADGGSTWTTHTVPLA